MDTEVITALDKLVPIVGNFGFPLVLAIYLLLRFEKKLESLTEAIDHLKQVIKKQ